MNEEEEREASGIVARKNSIGVQVGGSNEMHRDDDDEMRTVQEVHYNGNVRRGESESVRA